MRETKKEILSIIKDQVMSCQHDITTYNSIFVTSSVLSSILAAIATVISAELSKDNTVIWNIFYLLPTVYFLSLYNLIKYTTLQIKLGSYRNNLENQINELLEDRVLYWEEQIKNNPKFVNLSDAIQFVFFVPIAVFMIWGFWQIQHNTLLWKFMFVITILQIITVIIISVQLMKTVIKRK